MIRLKQYSISNKQRRFIITILLANILFIFLQIDKHNRIIHYVYKRQQLQHELKKLQKQHDKLTQELCYAQRLKTIKHYAQKHLHMNAIQLNQLKKLSYA